MESSYFCLLACTGPVAFSGCAILRKTLNGVPWASGNGVFQTKHSQAWMGGGRSICHCPAKFHFASVLSFALGEYEASLLVPTTSGEPPK